MPAVAHMAPRDLLLLPALLLWALPRGVAAHPCEAEISSACPDRPPAELAGCLKNPADHDTPTALSSECTDFVALNKACDEDIKKFCDEAFFSEDTVLCLKTWTDAENISPKCASVMKWAIPSADGDSDGEESDEGPTDELGMSEKDREEKKEWQAKRRAERGDAIERMKMKERDAKKERDRVELENFKKDHPEEYAEMIKQQEEDKRQAAEIKRRERLLAAALERKKRQEAGLDDDEQDTATQMKSKRSPVNGSKKKGGSSFMTVFSFLLVVALLVGAYFLAVKFGAVTPKKSGGGKKKKRG